MPKALRTIPIPPKKTNTKKGHPHHLPTYHPNPPQNKHTHTNQGFRRLATVPKAARLRGEAELVDAHMYYYDLTAYK